MAIFDIPLRVRLSIKLHTKRSKEGYTVTDNGDGTYQAVAEIGLSMRVHHWVNQNVGLMYGDHPNYSLDVSHSHDGHCLIHKSKLADLHSWLSSDRHAYCGDESNHSARRFIADAYYLCEDADPRRAAYSLVMPKEDEWKLREGMRFVLGHYKEVPEEWQQAIFYSGSILDPRSPDYVFPHISTANDGMIAFTENSKKGAADIQKRMKPGKFLKEHFGDKLNDIYGENKANAIIAQMAAQFGNAVKSEELQFAKTPDEIVKVYKTGPTSCMSHSDGDYDTREWGHPTAVFGAGDLQVAYISRGGRVTARALVWPEKKVWTRIYGDQTRIEPLLRAQGYNAGGMHCLDGAKLLKEKGNWDRWPGAAYVVPYVDGHSWANDNGDHLVIDHKGYIFLQNTCGTAEGGKTCKMCEKMARHNEMRHLIEAPLARRQLVCHPCWEKNTWQCAFSGDRYGNGFPKVIMANGEAWSEEMFRGHGFTCGYDKTNYPINGSYSGDIQRTRRDEQRIRMWDGSFWHFRNFEKNGKHYKGKNYSLAAYERQICKDMGQSELPLAEAAYAKQVEDERKAHAEKMRKMREEAEKKERDRRNTRRRTLAALRRQLAQQGITMSHTARSDTPYFRYIPVLGEYRYVSSQHGELPTGV